MCGKKKFSANNVKLQVKSANIYLEVCVVDMFEDQSRGSGLKQKNKNKNKCVIMN